MSELTIKEVFTLLKDHTLFFCSIDQKSKDILFTLNNSSKTSFSISIKRSFFLLRQLFKQQSKIFCFAEAQKSLHFLAKWHIEVARPVCLQTLEKLLPQTYEGFHNLNADDRSSMPELLATLLSKIERHHLTAVARLENLLIPVFVKMERTGFPLDATKWEKCVAEHAQKRLQAKEKIITIFGDLLQKDLFGKIELSLDNEHQNKAYLEQFLGHSVQNMSKESLQKISHPFAQQLLVYREHNTIVKSYGEHFLSFVRGGKRIYGHFIPLGASTGRVASSQPNLQNLPSHDCFRACIKAPRGSVLITADYSACELRILAEFSEDPLFIKSFIEGKDLHSVVASKLFSKEVTKHINSELRQKAKAINFGLMYGMGAQSLASQLTISLQQAQDLIRTYFQQFPKLKQYLESSVDIALKNGYSKSKLGRKLFFKKASLVGESAKESISRIAKNMPIQGTSADITKLAMIRIEASFRLHDDLDAVIVHTIHDEIVVEAAVKHSTLAARIIETEMLQAHTALIPTVPGEVTLHIGQDWRH